MIRPHRVQKPRAPLAVALDQRSDDLDRLLGRRRAFEAETHEVHAEQSRVGDRIFRVDRVVADRDTVLVDPVFEAPQPVGPRTDERMGMRDLLDLDVLTMQRFPRIVVGGRHLDERLALALGTIAVLGEKRLAARAARCRHDDTVAADPHFHTSFAAGR